MMITRQLYIKNFKSFRGEHRVDFTTFAPGLYYLGGRNEVDAELGSNGSGKSSIWEAWYWCRYGKTPRSLRAGDVKSWGVKEACVVQEVLEVNGNVLEIERCQGPNALRIYDQNTVRDVVQEDLQAVLRLNPTEFAQSLFLGQGTPLFFDLTPSAQTEIFESVLELELWNSLAQTSGKLVRAIETNEWVSLESKRAKILGKQETLEQRAAQLTQELSTPLAPKAQRQRLKELKKALARLTDELVDAEQHVEALQGDCEGREQTESEARSQYHAERTHLSVTQAEVQRLQGQIKKLTDLGAECPTCLQVIRRAHRDRCQQELESQLVEAQETVTVVEQLVDKFKAAWDAELVSVKTARQQVQQAQQAGTTLTRELNQVEREYTQIEQELASAEKEHQRVIQEQEAIAQQLKTLAVELTECEAEQVEQQKIIDAAEYWSKGFRHVRLLAITQALESLEIEVNAALEQLGLIGWRVVFDVERETKAKTISKGLSVNFYPPNSKTPIPWGAWSGGESQRLRLAGRIGISNMILQYRGVRPSLEIWDEPTQFLSQEGIDDLVAVLRQRAQDLGIQIWLVDHRSYDLGGFAGHLRVRKTQEGSVIENSCSSASSVGE